jgi:outer membrane receptor protein involved in Fe transport
MEYDALVINYGLRYDYFDAQSVYPSNRQNPANQGEYEDPSFQSTYIEAEPQVQISPRLGLSYTLGRSAVLHFSYGHFFQMPPFFALYTNNRFMVPNNNFGTEHGNAGLKAQKTVKYEMGIWQELTPGLGLELSVYYSDIYDLLTAVVWTTYNQIQYAVYDNKDYANTKGLEVKLDYTNGPIVANLNYTLQYTRGNADNPRSTYNRLAQNQDPIPKLIPLSWDQRHTVNLNVGYTTDRYALSATGFYNSGFPYNIEPILESRLARQNLTPNTGKKPSNYRVDLQGHYDLPINSRLKFRFYVYIKNLLDQLNEDHVYGSTGRAYTAILGNTAFETFRSNYNTIYDQYENPGMYSAPREIKLGVGLMF